MEQEFDQSALSGGRPTESSEAEPYVHDTLLATYVRICAIKRGRNGTYEEGINKGVGNYNELIPIEGGEGVQP